MIKPILILMQLLQTIFSQTIFNDNEYCKFNKNFEKNFMQYFYASYNIEIHSTVAFDISYVLNILKYKTVTIYGNTTLEESISSKDCIEITTSQIEPNEWRKNCYKYAILIQECIDLSNIKNQIKSLKIEADVYLIATCICSGSENVIYYNILQHKFGTWNQINNCLNFMGEPLKIQIIRTLTARIKGNYSENQTISEVELEGIDPMVTSVLSSTLNFTLDLKGDVSSRYGYKKDDGTFTGNYIFNFQIDIQKSIITNHIIIRSE